VSDDPSSPSIAVSDRQGLSVDTTDLVALASETLRREGATDVELSVSLVTEDEIAALHQRYLGEAGPTDVLSFPLDEAGDHGEPRLLGDVVICPSVAARQATDLHAEVRLLLVHGILHLLGYDHQEDAERRVMWERQEAYSGVRAT
jgi:probable rRNA maturation factor